MIKLSILTRFWQTLRILQEALAATPQRWNGTPGGGDTTPSLFPRLVLGWINADFRVQIRIFQHFSRSSRISSSRKQISKILQNFAEFCKIIEKICEIFRKFVRICKLYKFLQNFLQNFVKSCRFWKMLKNAILDAKNCEDFAKIWQNLNKKLTKISRFERAGWSER